MPRPRLPMMLGLAVLTTMAHFLATSTHFIIHATSDIRDWWLLLLLALAPFVGIALTMNGRPRHGAIVLVLSYLAAAWHTLYSHYWLLDDLPATKFYAGLVQMMLAFELQGMCAGIILSVKPEVPRPRAAATP